MPALLGKAAPLSGSGADAGNPTAKLSFAPKPGGDFEASLEVLCHLDLCCGGNDVKLHCASHGEGGGKKKVVSWFCYDSKQL